MRIAVISDVHSNLLALDAVLAQAGAVDAIWHLGDIVGYGPEPDAVVERLASVGALGVRGNHDAAAGGGTEIDWFNPDARSAMEWTRGVISDRTRSWLVGLPERREEADFTLVHGSGRDPTWEYVTTAAAARESLAVMTTRHGLNGHTHIPIAFLEADDRVGPVGPDGRARANGHRPRTRPPAAQPGQRRPAARRRSAGQLPDPRHGRPDRDLAAGGLRRRGRRCRHPRGRPAGSPGRAAPPRDLRPPSCCITRPPSG